MPATGERVLVVESDPDISALIARQALRPLGYEVKIVDRADQAIEEALKNPPDLIIANLNLPDLGGKDVLAAISAQGVKAPLVVIAERGEEPRAIQAFRLGAADALLWPAKDAEVVQVVERALQPTRSRRIRRQLYQNLESAQEELERRGRDLAALLSLARATRVGGDQPQLLSRLLESAVQVANADMAWINVRDDDTGTYRLRAHRNLPAAWGKKLNQPFDDGLSSLVTLSGRALSIHGRPMEKFKVAALGNSAAVVPVKVGDEVVAVLVVMRKADVEIGKATESLLEAVADMASVWLLNRRLFRALETVAATTRLGTKKRNTLIESLRLSIDRLRGLQSGDAGELTKDQEAALDAIVAALDRSARAAGGDGAAISQQPP